MHASSRHHPGGGSGAAGRRAADASSRRQPASLAPQRGRRFSMLVGSLMTMAAIGMIVASAYDRLATHNLNIGQSMRAVVPAILSHSADTAASSVPASAAAVASSAPAASGAQAQSQIQAQASADDRRNTAVINSLARHRPPASAVPLRGRHLARESGSAPSVYGHH